MVETIHLVGTQLALALSHLVGCKISSCGCTKCSHLAVDIGVQRVSHVSERLGLVLVAHCCAHWVL